MTTGLHELPPVLDMAGACEILRCSSKTGYRMLADGTFPSPVLRLGRLVRIPTAPLLEVLGIAGASTDAGATLKDTTHGGSDALTA